VELRVKPAGPPAKAKYSSMTDSGQVGRLNDEKHSDELSEKHLKPYTYKRSERELKPKSGGLRATRIVVFGMIPGCEEP
jgi:hypothetical protein